MNTSPNLKQLAVFCLLTMGSYAMAGTPGSKVALYYESLAGDFSDIKLSINEDHSFALEMYMFDEDKNYVMSGEWIAEGSELVLTFTDNKPYIEALFAPYMIVDDSTFRFSPYEEELWIWDTLCSKTDPAVYVACR